MHSGACDKGRRRQTFKGCPGGKLCHAAAETAVPSGFCALLHNQNHFGDLTDCVAVEPSLFDGGVAGRLTNLRTRQQQADHAVPANQ